MPDILGQMFFRADNGSRDVGWSEDHWIVGGGDLKNALAMLIDLADARASLLGAGCVINYLRVSASGVFRDSQIASGINPGGLLVFVEKNTYKPIPFAGPPGDPEAPVVPSSPAGFALNDLELVKGIAATRLFDAIVDQPNIGYLTRLELGPPFVGRRSLLLRGMPDGVIVTTSGGPSTANGPLSVNWLKLYNKWGTILLSGKYGMRANDAAEVPKPIAAWTVVGVAPIVVTATTAIAHTLVPGDKVYVSGVKIAGKKPGTIQTLNGSLTVNTTPTPTTVTFLSTNPQSPFVNSSVLENPAPLANGTIRKNKKVIAPYVKLVGRRWGDRKCGIPFDPSHGRAKAKK